MEEGTDDFDAELMRRMDEAREEWEADHEEVLELGGLYVVGTTPRGAASTTSCEASGRQGDPGETRFFLSGADDLVRLFAGDRIQNIMARFKVPRTSPWRRGSSRSRSRTRRRRSRSRTSSCARTSSSTTT